MLLLKLCGAGLVSWGSWDKKGQVLGTVEMSCMDPRTAAYHLLWAAHTPFPQTKGTLLGLNSTGRNWAGKTVWSQGGHCPPFLPPVWPRGLKAATKV